MRKGNSNNISNYHYRVDYLNDDDNKIINQKYFYTLNDICDEFNTTTFTIYRLMKNKDFNIRNESMKHIKIYKDYKPAFKSILNNEINGMMNEFILIN